MIVIQRKHQTNLRRPPATEFKKRLIQSPTAGPNLASVRPNSLFVKVTCFSTHYT